MGPQACLNMCDGDFSRECSEGCPERARGIALDDHQLGRAVQFASKRPRHRGDMSMRVLFASAGEPPQWKAGESKVTGVQLRMLSRENKRRHKPAL
jgi:hypothetical protein